MEPGLWKFRQRITDVKQWQRIFYHPEMVEMREKHALLVSNSCIAHDDPNVMVIIMTVGDSQSAERFMADHYLAEFRAQAALIGEPVMQRLGTPVGPTAS